MKWFDQLHWLQKLALASCMFLAGCGNDDAEAVKALKALKAGMGTDENGSVIEVDFSNSQATDDDLVHLKGLPKLSTLFIGSQISDKGMAHVEGLTTLTFVDCTFNTKITDKGVSYLCLLYTSPSPRDGLNRPGSPTPILTHGRPISEVV